MTGIIHRDFASPYGKQYSDDLYGRIFFLRDQDRLKKADELQDIRKRRNTLSHEISAATWEELSRAVDLIEETLQQLGYVGKRAHFECFAEQSIVKASDDPEIWGTQDFRCGVKENGKLAMEFTWRQNFYRQ